ncbi:hypothetical protein Trco_002730 [Trichoderma cornu-damae]|uniref:DUF7514 domain-containing protein n=1 Tax=Trichoderma cornu-damae TaxID=654480 RepID=A0A9P8TZE3_9HYPO|nr:hypothetical protein Trco_002730 [Trichoderma cornu-damae]
MAVPRSNGSAPPGAIKYAYMFEADKSPTMQFDALLRAIARFIVCLQSGPASAAGEVANEFEQQVAELGDQNDTHLTPKKLAAFYKAVGGDYDSLFLETPHSTISYMWQVTGCQHSLQPTENDFAAPSVPALTPRGFSRWESVEILLGPEEHVPFIQYAVRRWALRHPETGQTFPPDLPATVFPAQPDQMVDKWHKQCADQMRDEAYKEEEEEEEASMPSSSSAPKPEPSPEPTAPKFAYVHTSDPFHASDPFHSADPFHPTSPRSRAADPNQFERFTYVRVGERHGANLGQRPSMRSPERSRRQRPADDAARRRSFSDYASTHQPNPDSIRHSYSGTYLNPDSTRPTPGRPGHDRRHGHPQRHSSDSSGDESAGDGMHLRARRRQRTGSPPPGVRRVVPPSSSGPPPASAGSSAPSFRTHRSDSRAEESRRRGSPFGSFREKMAETVSNILPGSHSRNSSRQSSVNDPHRVRRSREHIPPSRLNQNHSDLASDGLSEESSEEERRRRRRLREERERERERDRYRADDQDSGGRRERPQHPRRTDSQRRTSSHADVDRRREPGWDMRDRERMREERKKWDRRSMENLPSPGGIPSRRYQEPAYT